MNPNNFRVIKLDGTEFDMADNGIIVNRFVPRSPAPIHTRESVDGRNGFIDTGTTLDSKQIDSSITVVAADQYDYPLFRNEIFMLFDSREYFYIVPDEEPGKRYKVKYDSPYSFSRTADIGEFDLTFVSDSSFVESLGTTLDPLTFESELWQVGQGLSAEDLEYIHNTNSFSIFNAGVEIDPRELPLKITYVGASSGLTITNSTTGDTWSYNSNSLASDEIVLDRVQSFKNGVSIFGDTNHKLIKLAPGWNDFVISGTDGEFEIKFDFRFQYL